MQCWDELYPCRDHSLFRQYKFETPNLLTGFSAPAQFKEYRVVYSCALKSNDEVIKNKIRDNIETFLNMGRFCLLKILKAIPLPTKPSRILNTPSLKLVINNQRQYENPT